MPISKDNKSNNQSRRVYNTRSSKMEQKLKKNSESDSSDNDDASTHSGSESEEDAMDVHEYRKFLQKIFPSKNLKNKIISGERLKRTIENEEGDEAEEEEDGEEEERKKRRGKEENVTKKDL